jgi:hypothetical protein
MTNEQRVAENLADAIRDTERLLRELRTAEPGPAMAHVVLAFERLTPTLRNLIAVNGDLMGAPR